MPPQNPPTDKQTWSSPGPPDNSHSQLQSSHGTSSTPGFLQPESNPTEARLNEVKEIYAGLIMVEKKCIQLEKQQSESKKKLSSSQWQILNALHQTLLQEHHDFFLASQHPLVTPVLKRLSEKYAMPKRLWHHGIYSFLELLRGQLPDSLEHMLTFIYLAYSMMTLLLESVPAFEDTWIECLADLARYRMAVEESDLRDREVWAGVARYWYNKAADKNPDVGRIQHHLAVLARPDIVQQLFYYTKSLVSVHSFASTRESIPSLFNPLLNTPRTHHQYPVITAFVAAHGYLFLRTSTSTSTDQFVTLANEFLSALSVHIGRMGAAFKMQGVYMTSCNFAAILDYGQADATFIADFKQVNQPRSHSDLNAAEKWTPESNIQVVEADFIAYRDSKDTQYMFYGSYLAAQTLSVILEQIGNKNIYPAVHISLAFFWRLALNFTMKHIEAVVPWRKIVTLLNTVIRDDTDPRLFERTEFPFAEETKQIPEDFLIRGQIWSQLYFPPHFFENCLEDEARFIEVPSLNVSRMYRCLWLGVRIATFNRWIKYDPTLRKFSIASFASELERVAQQHNPFHKAKTLQPSLSDFEMRDAE